MSAAPLAPAASEAPAASDAAAAPDAPVALITGASRGLGRAIALELARRGWSLVVDARTSGDLAHCAAELEEAGARAVQAIPGSVASADHRAELTRAVAAPGRLDLLVNNASLLGPSPQPRLADYPLDEFEQVYAVNVTAPLALIQLLLPSLRASHGRILNVTSDASIEPYDGWGGYGSSKAALDQLNAILGAEEADLRIYALDPGDMRTVMHQAAFPGEDISDRPLPDTVVPAVLRLIEGDLPSGRYRASALLPATRPTEAGPADQSAHVTQPTEAGPADQSADATQPASAAQAAKSDPSATTEEVA